MEITRAELKEIIRDALKEHHCAVFKTEEDRVMARDMIRTGKRFKAVILSAIVLFLAGGVGINGYYASKMSDLVKSAQLTAKGATK